MAFQDRRWFQNLAALTGVAITLALVVPIYLVMRSHPSAAGLGLPFLAAAAVTGFSRLLTLLLPPVLVKLWPALDEPAL